MKLRQLRIVAGLSQTELARKSGLKAPSVISRIETGKNEDYSPKTMKAIAEVLGVPVLEIDEFSERIEGNLKATAA